jgi:16S rRNA (cytosine967-C5)-methyltransferase
MNKTVFLTARHAAWKTLNRCDLFRHDTAHILSGLLEHTDRPAQANDIVFGVIRNQHTLDRVLTQCAAVDPARVKPAQWNLLRIGIYEFVYTPETADYAIINEAVKLARQTSSKKSSGFVNAVLRKVQRSIEERQAPRDNKNARRIIPQTPDTGCLFHIELLPDPSKETISYLNLAFSLPQTLIREWLTAYGREQTTMVCFASNRNPSVILQPNTLITTAKDLAQQLDDEQISNELLEDFIRVKNAGKINKIRAYLDGVFYVQDITAHKTVAMLAPQAGWTVPDLCAAPGGKSIALALQTQDSGLVLASDADLKRLGRVRENAKRLRLKSIEVVPAHRIEQRVRKQKQLDAIVLDVPCSNTGVLARRPEARWRWKPKAVDALIELQQNLLEKAAALSRPGTKILYSTCSIQPNENQQQIQRFLTRHNQFTLLSEKLTLPSLRTENAFDHDGGYAAVLQM